MTRLLFFVPFLSFFCAEIYLRLATDFADTPPLQFRNFSLSQTQNIFYEDLEKKVKLFEASEQNEENHVPPIVLLGSVGIDLYDNELATHVINDLRQVFRDASGKDITVTDLLTPGYSLSESISQAVALSKEIEITGIVILETCSYQQLRTKIIKELTHRLDSDYYGAVWYDLGKDLIPNYNLQKLKRISALYTLLDNRNITRTRVLARKSGVTPDIIPGVEPSFQEISAVLKKLATKTPIVIIDGTKKVAKESVDLLQASGVTFIPLVSSDGGCNTQLGEISEAFRTGSFTAYAKALAAQEFSVR